MALELDAFDEIVEQRSQTEDLERVLSEAFDRLENQELLAHAWLLWGRLKSMHGNIAEARDSFEMALVIAEEAGLERLAIEAQARANSSRAHLGDEVKLELHDVDDPKLQADLLVSEASLRYAAGRPHEALSVSLRAEKLYAAADNLHGLVTAKTGTALCYFEFGRYEDAARSVEEADRLSDGRFEHLFAYRRVTLARTLHAQGETRAAAGAYREGRELYHRLGNALMAGYTDMWEGESALAERRFTEAIALFESAGAAFESAKNREAEALATAARALAHQMDGQSATAQVLASRVDRGACDHPAAIAVIDVRRAQLSGDQGLLESARARLGPDGRLLAETSEPYRLALNLLEQATPAATPSTPPILIGPGFEWVRSDGQLHPVPNGHKVRTLLSVVFEERQRNPGAWVPIETLYEKLWAGERMRPASRTNRLNVMISRLRRLGLGKRLERSPEGLRLDPSIGFVIGG